MPACGISFEARSDFEHAKGFIRRQLGSVLRTKSIPDLRFHYDDAAESADRMEDLIEQARDKDRELRGEPESPGSEPPTSEPPGA